MFYDYAIIFSILWRKQNDIFTLNIWICNVILHHLIKCSPVVKAFQSGLYSYRNISSGRADVWYALDETNIFVLIELILKRMFRNINSSNCKGKCQDEQFLITKRRSLYNY